MTQRFFNNASFGRVLSSVGATTTIITVETIPVGVVLAVGDFFKATLLYVEIPTTGITDNGADIDQLINTWEVVDVTNITGQNLTMTRRSSTAFPHLRARNGSRAVELRMTHQLTAADLPILGGRIEKDLIPDGSHSIGSSDHPIENIHANSLNVKSSDATATIRFTGTTGTTLTLPERSGTLGLTDTNALLIPPDTTAQTAYPLVGGQQGDAVKIVEFGDKITISGVAEAFISLFPSATDGYTESAQMTATATFASETVSNLLITTSGNAKTARFDALDDRTPEQWNEYFAELTINNLPSSMSQLHTRDAYVDTLGARTIYARGYQRSFPILSNRPPTVSDDETKGITVGTIWMTEAGTEYFCYAADEGEAVWDATYATIYPRFNGGGVLSTGANVMDKFKFSTFWIIKVNLSAGPTYGSRSERISRGSLNGLGGSSITWDNENNLTYTPNSGTIYNIRLSRFIDL